MTYLGAVAKLFRAQEEENAALKKRILELEARECRLLTQDEIKMALLFGPYEDCDEAVQRAAFEVNGLKVKS